MCFQNMTTLAGLPINAPKFKIGGVCTGPKKKFRKGNNSNEPPPPETVENKNANVPARKRSKYSKVFSKKRIYNFLEQ